jgi:acyl-coenzyme A thioesterase PaaI-like protein
MRPEHVGWPGIVHGGLVFTLLDEAVAWALTVEGLRGVTARAEARFRQPVNVGVRLIVSGRIVEQSRRLIKARSELRRADDHELLAELDAKMYVVESAAASGQ